MSGGVTSTLVRVLTGKRRSHDDVLDGYSHDASTSANRDNPGSARRPERTGLLGGGSQTVPGTLNGGVPVILLPRRS